MATTPPTSTAHDRSAPPSDSLASLPTSSSSATATSPAPLAIPSAGAQQPSSALSASLKAFRELAAVHKGASENAVDTQQQHPFATDEFKQAYHHARRTSFGQQAGATQQGLSPGHAGPLPALSTSPSTSSDAGTSAGSLPTPPSSSPPPAKPRTLTTQTSTTNGTNTTTTTNGSSLKQKKPSSTLGGVCEGPEIALENGQLGLSDQDLLGVPISSSGSTITASPTSTQTGAGTGMFSGGAKWGWTSSSSSAAASPGTTSPAALASPPIGSVGSAFAPMSLPVTGALGGPGGGDSDLLSPTHRRRGSISFATPATTTGGGGGSSSMTTAATSSAGTGIPIPTSAGNSVTSPLATSPPTNDPFRMMQPLTRVVSAGAALQTPNAAKNGSAKSSTSSGAADGFGLFRRFSIGGLGARKTRPAPAQPPSPPSGFGDQHQHQFSGGNNTSSNLPAPTLLEPTHASLSPATISTTEAKAKPPPPPGVRGRTLAPAGVGGGGGAGGGAKPRKLSPMGERILRGGY
ncbi:hypothetical protein RHOSPDRAFT_28928 [Rhodotorula sp. JG-1b]|nr:hypothetical protein RHOSPDRAFT_28928 [Rhodotorula sp. JG-1b]